MNLIKEITKYEVKHIHHSNYEYQRRLREIYTKRRIKDLNENISTPCKTSLKRVEKIWKQKLPEIKPEWETKDKKYFNLFPHNIKKKHLIWPIIAALSLTQLGDLNKNAKINFESQLENKINVVLRLKSILPDEAWAGIASTLDACRNSENVHPLYAFSMFNEESEFNENAVSKTLAVGWGQLMGPTAKELGMKNIYMVGFDEFQNQRRLKNEAEMKAFFNFKIDNYSVAIKYKKEANQLTRTCQKLRENYIEGMKENKDARLDLDQNIYASVKLQDELYEWLNKNIKNLTDFERDVLVASAYNAGKGAVEKYDFTVPLYNETAKHAWKVWFKYREYQKKDLELYEYLKENYINKAQ